MPKASLFSVTVTKVLDIMYYLVQRNLITLYLFTLA